MPKLESLRWIGNEFGFQRVPKFMVGVLDVSFLQLSHRLDVRHVNESETPTQRNNKDYTQQTNLAMKD